MTANELKQLREAVANYMRSEGCSCCRGDEHDTVDTERLAELLSVPKYKDGSGYDFNKFQTEKALKHRNKNV